MTKSRAEIMAYEYGYKECNQLVTDGLSEIQMELPDFHDTVAEIFLAGMKAMLAEAEKMAIERPIGDGIEKLVILSGLKKLLGEQDG